MVRNDTIWHGFRIFEERSDDRHGYARMSKYLNSFVIIHVSLSYCAPPATPSLSSHLYSFFKEPRWSNSSLRQAQDKLSRCRTRSVHCKYRPNTMKQWTVSSGQLRVKSEQKYNSFRFYRLATFREQGERKFLNCHDGF